MLKNLTINSFKNLFILKITFKRSKEAKHLQFVSNMNYKFCQYEFLKIAKKTTQYKNEQGM